MIYHLFITLDLTSIPKTLIYDQEYFKIREYSYYKITTFTQTENNIYLIFRVAPILHRHNKNSTIRFS
jgi:hypothetical protein